MSFDALAHQITNELVADLKTRRHLRLAWDQIEHADRAGIIEHWRSLIVATCKGDAQQILQRYFARGVGSEQALELAADEVRKLIEKES